MNQFTYDVYADFLVAAEILFVPCRMVVVGQLTNQPVPCGS